MKYVPEPDQVLMTKHLRSKGKRKALLVGMGRGKTAATLDALCDLIADTAGAALVIAPLNVCLLTWPAEIKLWDQFKWLRIANLCTSEGVAAWHARSADVYLINWESLPRFIDKVLAFVRKGEELPANVVIYDELSKAKSHASKRVNKWRRFTYLFDYHWALTGTPNPNSYLDLFAQFRLLCGQKSPLGTAFGKFQRQFFTPLDWNQYKWGLQDGAKERIEKLIAPYVLSLGPGKFPLEVIDREVPLHSRTMSMYRELEEKLLLEVGDKEVSAANAAVLVQKLCQFTSGRVYNEAGETVAIHDAKLRELEKIVREHKGKPILVATMFKHERERIFQFFPQADAFDNDPRALKLWSQGDIPMWVIDPRSAGHGLNLQHGGHVIVWTSLTYSRELYDQTNARLARKGQKETVLAYRLICPMTVDEAVAAVLEHKGTQQNGLLTALSNIRTLHES